ncbi:tetratricopeptide repeat protein, partial [Rothia dentocariosa]
DDNPETYAKAQLNLGVAYYAQEDWEQAIAAWSNIHREDDSEAYTRAQLGLGAAYYAQEDWEQAIAAWSNI